MWSTTYQRELPLEVVEKILESLADINPELLDAACMQANQECKYFPTVSEIRARVKKETALFRYGPRYEYTNFSDCRKEQLQEVYIPATHGKPAGIGKLLCGCGNCAPWLWCRHEQCTELRAIDPWTKIRQDYCPFHMQNSTVPLKKPQRRMSHWETRAEEIIKQTGGKDGFMQLCRELGMKPEKMGIR